MQSATLPSSFRSRAEFLYPGRGEEFLELLQSATAEVAERLARQEAIRNERWDEQDVVLITYADQLRQSDESSGTSPLVALREWLKAESLDRQINTVHLLPFCPYTSDDGFSVVDYLEVDPTSGTWDDIARLNEEFELMFDLVLNHISQASDWFQSYLRREHPYDEFFIAANPDQDLSQVVRPRSLPLLSSYQTADGTKHVWTTFSADQVDLNYGEPRVLAEMLRVLLEYAERGARIVRLDAVAFLWKQLGTSCLHLPQTHEVVKLCRDLLEHYSPQTLVLTETNVPHAENVSYFGTSEGGSGDEAHMVYNFSLPPLLLDAFVNGDATAIRDWLERLADPPAGCTFFNFTASHDGIGMRPLEGLVSEERFANIVEAVRQRGGKINTRRKPDGTDAPYELNISYVDAMSPSEDQSVEHHARRFLATQAVMLALRGMPAVYFHSLVGTRNDEAGVQASGQNRRINRHKYTVDELNDYLAESNSLQREIYDGYRNLLTKRIAEPAFHPDAPQQVVDLGDDRILGLERQSLDGSRRVLLAANFAEQPVGFVVPDARYSLELISGDSISSRVNLLPGQAVWLSATA